MEILAEIKVDIKRNIPIILDQLVLMISGLILISSVKITSISFWIGLGLVLLGLIQLIRRIKQFILYKDILLIKRPLLPFHIADVKFKIDDVSEVKFHKIKGRFGGNFISIYSKELNCSYLIATKEEDINQFENQLKKINVKTIRDGL